MGAPLLRVGLATDFESGKWSAKFPPFTGTNFRALETERDFESGTC